MTGRPAKPNNMLEFWYKRIHPRSNCRQHEDERRERSRLHRQFKGTSANMSRETVTGTWKYR